MPIAPTYPGVYIEEIPSGVRTVTGVATSITAFVGRALRGAVNEPIGINSYGDFERIFGGLWLESSLGYAVRDFYLNGGSQAIVVRLHKPPATNSVAKLSIGTAQTLGLVAASPGTWGNKLRARVDHDTRALSPTEAANSLFNLTIRDTGTGQTEVFRNVSVTVGHPRQVDNVLVNESSLVRKDPAVALPAQRPDKQDAPAAGEDIWSDHVAPHVTSIKVETANLVATDGAALTRAEFTTGVGLETNKQGLYALKKADLFNLLCIPPHVLGGNIEPELVGEAAQFCEAQRAFLLVDPPNSWSSKDAAKAGISSVGTRSNHAAIFFPRLKQTNPLRDNQLEDFAPCGAIAGIFARTDTQRGVWKAPAGLDATLVGVPQLNVPLNDAENGELNPLGINCLRAFPAAGRVVWGARTLQGDDRLASEWKYIPVRRLALYIEESLYRGTQWVVFEPNDEPLWAQIRLNLGAFMNTLFRQGAFQGKTPREAYLVKCDRETTTQTDINSGIVNIVVGFAPLKPAEFVIIKIQQLSGQIIT
ncbi:MAG: phage tail sheath family protein [Oscillatoriophycideae cyanobacterium NC_groundwater_1537_Pr4_S-0.65um_50_18]|nr:phage tail sheath family protein [Oscillatoriophycideae cyanobacterium NC_groundwater_1537_Pr4_S-0.65um_50_18]